MAQNWVQFQHGMSLIEFIRTYGTEAQCEAALERTRWPDGFVCPHCGGPEHSRFLADGRWTWQCSHCRKQTTCARGFSRSMFQGAILLLQIGASISAGLVVHLQFGRHRFPRSLDSD